MKLKIEKRIQRIWKDFLAGKNPDIRKRWSQVRLDLPEQTAGLLADAGPCQEATLDDVPLSRAIDYAACDADATLRLNGELDKRLRIFKLAGCYEMDRSILPMVNRMQQVGMLVDVPHFQSLDGYLTDLMKLEVGKIDRLVHTGPEFNPNSPIQVERLLFKDLKLTPRKLTPEGQKKFTTGMNVRDKDAPKGTFADYPLGTFSTQDKVLEAMRGEHKVIARIIDYREFGTMRDDFCLKMVRLLGPDGRIHPRIKVTRVTSGRLSMSEPNLMGIPVRTELGKLIRDGFVPDYKRGKIYGSWDLDQIEMREMAHQSEDPLMIKLFEEGADIHRMTGAMAFGKKPEDVTTLERYAAKRIGFGIITGITEKGLAEQMALAGAEGWDEDRCKQAIEEYLKIYKGVKRYMNRCWMEAQSKGYVRDRWGRIRYLCNARSDDRRIREEAQRQSHSFKISASAQGIMKHAMRAIWEWMRSERLVGHGAQMGRVEPLLQIHDSMLMECDGDKQTRAEVDAAMVYFMCETTKLRVPIRAKGGFGATWGEIE